MRLFHTPSSPFVRKVLVAAYELDAIDKIEIETVATSPTNQNPKLVAANPLGQIPTLVLHDGSLLADSRVIIEYLNDCFGGHLFTRAGATRWTVLGDQSLADNMTSAALITRYESTLRPAELRWPTWLDTQNGKIDSALNAFDRQMPSVGMSVDVGTIACACALSYQDLRFPDRPWRRGRPALAAWYEEFAQRPSMKASVLT